MNAYDEYVKRLTTGEMNESSFRNVWDQFDKDFSNRAVNIYNELKQQRQYTDSSWYGGKIGKENVTWDMALRLAETGVGSVYDIGQREVKRDVTDEDATRTQVDQELFNKKTGEALTKFNEIRESSKFDTRYNINFMPDGTPVAYTSNRPSDWVSFRDEVLKPALPIALMAFPGIGQAIGTALTPAGTSATVAGMVGGAVVGGTMAELTGGKFIKGAIMGATGAGASQFASNIGEMIGLQGKLAEQVGNAILQGARAELAGGDFLKGAAVSGLISTVSNATGYTEKDIRSVISAVKALDDPNVFKLAGAFSNLKNLDYFRDDKATALIADIAGGLDPKYGSNTAYDKFMQEAMTPEAIAAIEADIVGASRGPDNRDIGGGWSPASSLPTTNPYDVGQSFGPDNRDIGGGWSPNTDVTKKDTSLKFSPSSAIAGAVAGSQISKLTDTKPKVTLPTGGFGMSTAPASGDNYANAPIKGFAMRKYKNAAGQERYIPFVGDSPQINIPEGFTPVGMNKGGFIQRRS